MKRNLFTQMKNEWRDNMWLVIGLTIVSIAIWFFSSALLSLLRTYFIPIGVDVDDVYLVSIGRLNKNASNYVDFGDETDQKNSDDLRQLLSMIRNNPNVEAAGLSANGTPYSGGYWGNSLKLAGPEPDTIEFSGNQRRMSPELVKVLRLKSHTGKDLDYLQKSLESREYLLGPDPYVAERKKRGEVFHTAEELNGKMVFDYDTTRIGRVADVVDLIRTSRFQNFGGGAYIIPIDEAGNLNVGSIETIALRVKPGKGDKFRDEFNSDASKFGLRNTYLYNLRLLKEEGKMSERNMVLKVRLNAIVIGFLLLIIFLGLLGTFWFRMQQRVSEIAIRRVCGASQADVFRRVLGEGMILLSFAVVLTAIAGWLIIKKTTLIDGFTTVELLCLEGATTVLVGIGIVISILYPAWRAMKIEPAVAVRDE